jgi:hypothetical protein
MFCTPQACACSMAMMVMSSQEDGGDGTLEEAVVDASCRVAVAASAYRVAIGACSSSEE